MNSEILFTAMMLFVSTSLSAQATYIIDINKSNTNPTQDYQHRFTKTPLPPYYTVLFTIQTTGENKEALSRVDNRMLELAAMNPGFIGSESLEDEEGFILMMTYWKDLESIKAFTENVEHQHIQEKGKSIWFKKKVIRIAHVIKEYADEIHVK